MSTSIRLWRHRPYVLWLISDTAKDLGSALSGFALPLIVLFVTDDPAQAGVLGGVGLAVRLLVSLYGGVLADRHGRVLLMMIGAITATVLATAFTVLALADALTFTVVLVVEILLMARAGLFDSASGSALKALVPDDAMGRAQAANQGRDAAIRLTGSPLGGALLGVGGWLVGAAMSVCYVLAALTAWVLRRAQSRAGTADRPVPPASAVVTAAPPPRAAAQLREGFRWLFSRRDLRGVLVVATVVNLGFNTVMTTVVYGLQQAGRTELTIGIVSAGFGAAMLVGAGVAPLLVPRISAGRLTLAGLVAATAGAVALAFVDDPWGILAVGAVAVFGLPTLNAAVFGYFVVATPSALLGRANSAVDILTMGATPLAPLLAGFGLATLGRTPTMLGGAALCALAVVMALTAPSLRRLPVEAAWVSHAAQFAGVADTTTVTQQSAAVADR